MTAIVPPEVAHCPGSEVLSLPLVTALGPVPLRRAPAFPAACLLCLPGRLHTAFWGLLPSSCCSRLLSGCLDPPPAGPCLALLALHAAVLVVSLMLRPLRLCPLCCRLSLLSSAGRSCPVLLPRSVWLVLSARVPCLSSLLPSRSPALAPALLCHVLPVLVCLCVLDPTRSIRLILPPLCLH